MPRPTSTQGPSEPSTSSQPVAGPSTARQSQRAMTFHHYQPPSSAVDDDNADPSRRVAAAVVNGGSHMPLRWAKPQSVDENRALTSPLPRIPHHPVLPPPPSRLSSAPPAPPVVSSRNTTPLHPSSHHVPSLPLNGSPRPPVQPTQYGEPQRPLGPSRPSLDPNTSSQHESLNRTTIFTNISDLAAHYGIPQHLPPIPIKSAVPQPQDSNPAQPQSELPPDFDFQTLLQNYLNMLTQNNTEMSAINNSDLAAAAMGGPLDNDAMQLIMAVLSGTPNIPVAPDAAPQFTSPAFLSSPLDTPLEDFLDTPAIPDMEFSPDIHTSPAMLDFLGFPGGQDLPLFESMPQWDQPAAPAKPTPVNTNTTAFDGLIPMSPETPALDPSSLTPSPAFTDMSSFPADVASRPRKSLPTGTRKNVTPETLIPIDAPIQPRKYLTPSSTSRKDIPATFARKRARTGEADEHPPDEQEEDAIASKRLQNTLAARRSRKRKLEYQRQLEEELAISRSGEAALQARVHQLEMALAQAGLPLPP